MATIPTRNRIDSAKNRITVSGRVGLWEFRRLLAAFHNLTVKLKYQDIILDFSGCIAAHPGPMASVCASAIRLRRHDVDCSLDLPSDMKLRNLFMNAGWAYLIDPSRHMESRFRGSTHVPSIHFTTPSQQQAAVNQAVEAILSALPGLARSDLAAIEWSLNEITDNVLVHSQSEDGGVLHLTNYRQQKRVEFVVADAGVGIPATLRQGHPELHGDTEALDKAIREGVTRDKEIGQGNGLFGTLKVTEVSNGYLHVHSGFARLDYEDHELHIRSEQVPVVGTLVVACMDTSNPTALGEALKFEGRKHKPVDYIELKYETENAGELLFPLAREAASLGSRPAGTPVRTRLQNLHTMHPDRRIIIDFEGIELVSSSFADEAIAKLFVAVGPMQFMRAFELRNMTATVQALVDKAIVQRSRS